MHPSEGILRGVRATCVICHQMTHEPTICAGCGQYGHPECLSIEQFFDFWFCSRCIIQATAEYAAFRDAQRRESWRQSLLTQLTTWRSRAVEAIGMSSSLGVVMGGAVATAAGAAAGLAQGAVRGAVQVASASRSPVPEALPDAPPPTQVVPVRHRRARSQDLNASGSRGHCLACWTRNPGHRAHIYRGDCIGLSGQRIWQTTAATAAAPPMNGRGGDPPPLTDAAGVAVPDSEETLFNSVASVTDDPRGSGGAPVPTQEVPQTTSDRTVNPGNVGGDNPPTGSQLFEVALAQQSTSITNQSTGMTGGGALPSEAPQVNLEGRIGLLESQMMMMHRELRASREEMRNLVQAVKSSQEDFQRAASRIETLEFEWTVWNTEEGQASEARDPTPARQEVQEAGLITQHDLLGLDVPSQVEFQLTPRSGGGLEPERADPLMEWWSNPSPQGRPQALGPSGGPERVGNLPQLTTGGHASGADDEPEHRKSYEGTT